MKEVDEYIREGNFSPKLKECGIKYIAEEWKRVTNEYFLWSEISVDEYLYELLFREIVEDIISNSHVDEEYLKSIHDSDEAFKAISSELDFSFKEGLEATEENKRKYWYYFRVLKNRENSRDYIRYIDYLTNKNE